MAWLAGLLARGENNRRGAEAEQAALIWLLAQGLTEVQRNFRCRGGEIDLIMQDRETLVFVEVRRRSRATHGDAGASVTRTKQRRLTIAAQLFLQRYRMPPPCRFDVIAFDGDNMHWLKNAFEATPESF